MDKVIFSICKNGMNQYIFENKAGKKTYKFNDFYEIIGFFSETDHPTLPVTCRVVVPSLSENKINIYQRINFSGKKSIPKYYWSHSHNAFGEFEQISVREVLKQIKKEVKGW